MAKKYYGVRKGREVGVFTNWDEVSRLVTGFKGAEFKGFTNKREVSEYMGIPYIEEDKSPTAINKNKCIEEKTADDLIFEYRQISLNSKKIRYVSNLSDKQKNMLKSQMTKDEVNEYRKLANDLMEKRFNLVKRNKYILDYLLLNPEKVKYEVLKNKYNDIDLSITVYTIKSIINVMGESDFSKDDGSSYYNKNSDRYYDICKKYWCRIWWDTDTGVLSKEDIEKQRFSEYHKNCNKISTIAEIRKYLDNLKIKDFHQKYRLDYLIQRYKLDKR